MSLSLHTAGAGRGGNSSAAACAGILGTCAPRTNQRSGTVSPVLRQREQLGRRGPVRHGLAKAKGYKTHAQKREREREGEALMSHHDDDMIIADIIIIIIIIIMIG